VSAEVGTGSGETAFGGTSGATPMVSGSAALLLQKCPLCAPAQVKAQLMNSAETAILTNPALQPGVLAPITRIGAGEVRVDRAAALTSAAWDAVDSASVGLSFGYYAATGTSVLRKKVQVRNYAGAARTFSITPSFRYANDAASGALVFAAPATVNVPAHGSAVFTISMTIDASKLPVWSMDGGPRGGDGFRLQGHEFDGYLTLADATDTLRLPWHVLPHKAAAVKAASTSIALPGGAGSLLLRNTTGAVNGGFDTFALTGSNGRFPSSVLPRPGDNFAIVDLKAVGVRLVDVGGGTLAVQFGINTFGGRSHPAYPAQFLITIDNDLDGTDDFVVFTGELGDFATTGQTVVGVFDPVSELSVVRFFADADLNSANMIATALLSDLGLTPGAPFRFSVFAADIYFTGFLTDAIAGMVHTLGAPKHVALPFAGDVPAGGSALLNIFAVPGGAAASPSQTGVLLLYRDAKPGAEAEAITVTP
jgi:hypothetical protein